MASQIKARCQQGSALLAVMWLVAALSAIAFSLASTVRGETERTATSIDDARAYYLATGAIDRAILYMEWGGKMYHPGMSFFEFPFETGQVRVEIISETAKLSVNSAKPEEIYKLLQILGATEGNAQEITEAILDWRKPVPVDTTTPLDAYYRSLRPSFSARHSSFVETEELLLVKGMTPDLFYGTYEHVTPPNAKPRLVPRGGLRDCLSVYGSASSFDVNTAPPAVLATIGLAPDQVAAIIERRIREPFKSREELQQLGQEGAYQRLHIGGNSIYTLRSTARLRLPSGGLSDLKRTVAATVKFGLASIDTPEQTLRWYDRE